jgi:hypothetical protein
VCGSGRLSTQAAHPPRGRRPGRFRGIGASRDADDGDPSAGTAQTPHPPR